jgi:hypothetical protein
LISRPAAGAHLLEDENALVALAVADAATTPYR